MELNHGDGVPAWRRTGGGPEVGQELKGSKAVRLSTMSRVEVVRKVDLHDRLRRRRRGQWRRRCSGDQRRRWSYARASVSHG
jgi:hypothetical protein